MVKAIFIDRLLVYLMAGVKRTRQEMETKDSSESTSPFISVFEGFKAELDEHHDRRERVIKASRDITAFSKKVIFALQRYASPCLDASQLM